MKHLVVILLISMFAPFSSGNESLEITGTVYSKQGKLPLPGVSVALKGSTQGVATGKNGKYTIQVADEKAILVFSMVGFITKEMLVGKNRVLDVVLVEDVAQLSEVTGKVDALGKSTIRGYAPGIDTKRAYQSAVDAAYYNPEAAPLVHNTEEYSTIHENIFLEPTKNPLSTFSIDVDAASYSNIRRFLQQGQHPPKDAVRIEELINYFSYDYKEPTKEHPFSVYTELSSAPWNPDHHLLHIGLQGRRIPTDDLPASNLVFLIDVSGSMESPHKLGLLKSAFRLLTDQLRPSDKVAMVVYAGAAGVVLPSTAGDQQQQILSALDQLQAGGSTAGGAGIRLAYKIAQQHFIKEGNNRVILATDGDFNIGASSNAEMERLIEQEREKGIFLTVLGFGMGNYKDSKMEILANKGNGNYAYIDNIMEAKKVLVNEFGGTLFTIAKDVKLQIEFNPAKVKAYRLIGYENRKLRDEDFNNDQKDAGELGSGHTVTALYEIIPQNGKSGNQFIKEVDDLKYQHHQVNSEAYGSEDIMTMKLRYKQPDGDQSKLMEMEVGSDLIPLAETSNNFRWSAAVASFGMLLRDSEFKGDATYAKIEKWAQEARGKDKEGYRAEFIRLVQSGDLLVTN